MSRIKLKIFQGLKTIDHLKFITFLNDVSIIYICSIEFVLLAALLVY